MGFKILAINPGSTSTKIALYDDEQPTLALTLRHSAEEIARFPRIIDQLDWRKEMVLEALAKNNFDVKSLSAVCGKCAWRFWKRTLILTWPRISAPP